MCKFSNVHGLNWNEIQLLSYKFQYYKWTCYRFDLLQIWLASKKLETLQYTTSEQSTDCCGTINCQMYNWHFAENIERISLCWKNVRFSLNTLSKMKLNPVYLMEISIYKRKDEYFQKCTTYCVCSHRKSLLKNEKKLWQFFNKKMKSNTIHLKICSMKNNIGESSILSDKKLSVVIRMCNPLTNIYIWQWPRMKIYLIFFQIICENEHFLLQVIQSNNLHP